MIQTMTNIKKVDDTQRGMKSNKKVHKDLFKMMKFCAAFCCLLLCTVVNVQAQAPGEGEPRLEITDPSSKTYRYGANTGATTTGNNSIQFDLGGVGVTGWEHTIRYTHPGTYFSINPVNFLIGDGSISVSLTLDGVNTGAERSAVIVFSTVGGGTTAMDSITLTQAGRIQPTISVSPSSRTVGADGFAAPDNILQFGGFNAFTITVSNVIPSDNLGGGVGWRTSIDSGFVSLLPNDNGSVTSDASITRRGFTVDLNPTEEERTAVILFFTVVGGNVTVADTARVTITQAGRVGAVSPTLDFISATATDTVFMGRTGTPEVTLSFDVQYGSWSAMSEGFLTLSNLNSDSEGTCSTSTLCGGGAVDATKRRVIFKANGSTYSGSDRRTANVTMTVTGADTTTSKVITIIQRGSTTLTINPVDTLASGDGSTSAISFTTNGTWEAESDQNFITLSPTMGTGDATITATAASANITGSLRTATITIAVTGFESTGVEGPVTKTTTVSQAAMSAVVSPELTITPGLDTLAHDNASTSTIGFTTNGTWEAESDQNFITLSPTMGTGDATITATADENATGLLRTATITITATGGTGTTPVTRTVMLSQDEAPTITNISGSTRVIFPNPGANTQDLQDFTVGGSATGWTSTITYMPSGGEEFVTLTPDAGPRGADISVTAALDENTTSSQREAFITVTTTGRGTPVSNSFTIQQAAAAADPPTLTLTPPHTDGYTIRIDHTNNNGVDGLPTIVFNVGGGATGWTYAITDTVDNFIDLGVLDTTMMIGDFTVTATPEENTEVGAVERSATIRITTIGGAGDSATFAVTITQSASSFDFRVNRPGTITNPDGSLQASIVNISAAGDTTENDPIQFRVIPATADVTITSSHFIRVDTSSSLGIATLEGGAVPARTFSINYRLLANNTGAERTGTVTFTARSPVGSQTFTVTFTQDPGLIPTAGFGEITTQTGDFSLDAIRDPNVGHIAVFLGLPTSTTTLLSIGLVGTDITDLDSLIFLQSLTEHLIIDGTNITSLRGLDNLTRIDGNLIIQNNSMLTSLEGLEALTNVGGYVIIRDNGVLTSLAGLSALGTIGGDVTIVDNENLTSCCESATLAAAINTVRVRDGEIGLHTTISGNGSDDCNDVDELVGCSGPLPQAPDPTLTLTSAAMDTLAHDDASTSSIVFNVADATWTAASDQGFVTLDPSTNDNAAGDNLMLTATASANGTGMLRTATITITATGGAGTTPVTRTVMISQEAAPTVEITNPTRARTFTLQDHMSQDASFVFDVGGSARGWTRNINYTPAGANFITLGGVTMNPAQTGNVTNPIAVAENTGEERTAEIIVTTTGSKGTSASDTLTLTQPAAPPTLVVATNDTIVDHNSGNFEILFELGGTAVGWAAEVIGDDFITLNPAGPNPSATEGMVAITAMYEANTGMEQKDTIVFTTTDGVSDSVVITQSAAPPTLLLTSDATVTLAHDVTDAQTIRFTVGGGASGWTSSMSGDDFIMLSDDGATTGDVVVTATLSGANAGVARSAVITFTTAGGTGDAATATVTITQSAAPPSLLLTSDATVTLAHDVDVAQTITFTVGGSASGWTSEMTGDNFIDLSDNGNVTGDVVVTATPSGANAGVERSTMITFTTAGGTGDAATATVTITQSAAPPSLVLTSPSTVTLAHDVVTAQTITFTVGGSASGWTSEMTGDNFIDLSDNGNVTGDVVVTATPSGANAGVERSTMITFTTMGGTGEAKDTTVTITQGGAPPTLVLTSDAAVTLDHDVTDAQTIRFTVGGGASGWTSSMSGDDFIMLSDDGVTTGDVVVTATLSGANAGVERSAVITFTTMGGTGVAEDITVMITQEAAPPTLVLTSDATVTLDHDVTDAQTIRFTVGGGASGWTSAITGDTFIILADDGVTTGDVVVTATLSGANAGVERSAVITFTTEDGTGDAATATVTITQSAAPPTLLLTSDATVTLDHDVTDAQTIRFTVGGGASGWTSAITGDTFITLADDGVTTGDVVVTATLSGANAGVERSAMITFTTMGGTGDAATATVTITQSAAPPSLLLTSDATVTLAHDVVAGQTITFTVGGSASGWTSSMSGDNFITLTDDGATTGDVTVTATPSANISNAARSAVITFTTAGGTGTAATAMVTITQGVAGAPTLLLTSPSTVPLAHDVDAAQTITFTVGDATGWTSEITGNDFITLSDDDGNVPGDITVTATPSGANTGVERSAVITFTTSGGIGDPATAVVTITQGGAPPTLLLTSDATVTLDHDVTDAQTIRFTVGGGASDWTSGMSGDDFIMLSDDGATTGDVVVTATLSGANAGVERSTMITFTTMGGTGDAATATVTITQSAAPPTLLLTSDAIVTLDHSVTMAQTISFTVGGGASGWTSSMSGENFIILANDGATTGDVVVTATLSGANTGVERSTMITFTTMGGTGDAATATVTITQSAAPPTLLLTSDAIVTLDHDVTDAQTIRFTVGGGASGWTSSMSGDDFIMLSDDGATTGDVVVTATLSGANAGVERSAVITFTTMGGTGVAEDTTVMITQSAAPPSLVLTSPSTVTLAHDVVVAQTIRFTVGGGASGWTSSMSGDDFIMLSDDGATTGDVVVTATLSGANTGAAARSAVITFTTAGGTGTAATAMVTITQGVAGAPTLLLTSPSTVPLAHDVDAAQTITFTVGDATGWTSEITGNDFITLSDDDGNVPGDITVTATPSGANTGVERSAVITFTTSGGVGDPATAVVTITQAGVPPTFNVEVMNPTDTTTMNDSILGTITGIPAEGVTTTNNPIQFTVTPSTAVVTFPNDILTNHFIGVDTSSTVSGSSRTFNVNLMVAANNTLADRTGELIFTVTSDTETRIVKVTFTQTATTLVLSDISDYASSADSQAGVDGSATGDINGLGLEGVGITDLSSLTGITSLTGDDGDLVIKNTGLTSLAGLNNITSISGDLIIQDNNNLTSLEGLNALTNVGGHVVIRGNGALISVAGLAALGTISGDVTIQDNGMLSLCCGSVPLATAIEGVRDRTTPQRLSTAIFGNGSDNCGIGNIIRFLNGPCPPAPDLYIVNSDEVEIPANNVEAIEIQVSDSTLEDIDGNPDGLVDATGWVATIAYMPEDADFIDLTPEMGDAIFIEDILFEDGYFVITATPNSMNTGVERTAIITITTRGGIDPSSVTFTITQLGAAPVLTFTPMDETIAYDAESANDITFNVGGGATGWTSSIAYTPALAPGASGFITLTPDNMEEGDVVVTVVSTMNTTGVGRSAVITFTTDGGTGDAETQMVTITQEAAPTLNLTSAADVTLTNAATTAENITFTLGGSATGWTAMSSNENFIMVPSAGTIEREIMVTVVGTSTELRTSDITITTTGRGTPISRTVTITQEEAPAASPALTLISDSTGTLAHGGATSVIEFSVANATWTAESSETFVTLDMSSGDAGDNLMVTATAGANDGVERMAIITIAATDGTMTVTKTVTLTQSASPSSPALTLISGSTDTLAHGGATSVIEFSVANATWTAESSETFVTLDMSSGNAGDNLMVTATADANDGVERMATITITATDGTITLTKTVTLTQEAAPVVVVPPTLMVSTFEDTTINDESGSLSISFTLGGTAKGWTSEVKGADFITLDPAMSASDTNTAVTVMATYEANTGVERTDTIVFTTGDVADTIVITQSAGPPIFTLTSDDDETIAHDAEAASDITFNVGGGATGWWAGVIDGDSSNNFVMLDKTSGSAGLDTIKVTTSVNTGEARVDTVVVGTGGEGEATDTIIVTQEAVPTISLTDPVDGMIVIDYNAVTDTAITFDVGGSATDWTASSDQSFVTLDAASGASGTGLMATITENVDVQRTATITITTVGQLGAAKTATVMITQTGAPGSPAIEITTPSGDATVAYTATTTTTTSDSVEIMFTTANATGWESVISYGDGAEEFVTLTGNPLDTGEVTVKAAVTENVGVERSAKIVFSTTGTTGEGTFSSAKDSLTITQGGAPPTFMLTSANTDTIAHNAETASDITFEVGGGATGWWARVIDGDSGNNFVTLSETAGSAGLDTIKVITTANTGGERMDTLVITTVGGTGVLTDTIIVTQQAGPPTIVVSTDDTTINHDATGAFEISFTLGGSAMGWSGEVIGEDDFITLDPEGDTTATGEVTIMATASVNDTGAERKDTITFTTGNISDTVVITQRAAPPMVSITTTDLTIEASATSAIDVVFTVGGSATGWRSDIVYTPDGANFITYTPNSNANEKDEVTIAVTPTANTGAERVAKIVITPTGGTGTAVSDTVTITQKTGLEPPTLVISTDDTTINHDATDALSITFMLGGRAMGWQSSITGDEFITLDLEQDATATGEVTVMATPAAREDDDAGLERKDTIIFTTTEGIADTVVITQSEIPAPMISITTTDKTIEASATAAIDVVFTVGGSATGWRSSIVYTPANANFITHNPKLNANEKGDVTITATPTANTGAERVAKIVITPTGGTGTAVSDSIIITQSAGTLGISLEESLTLYPNPTDGVFFIEGLSGALEVHVHDLLGRQVATHSLSAGERKVDVSALSSGMYVVTLKESGGELLTRVLIRQ